jgi:methyltransferase (TIGR00027 family)
MSTESPVGESISHVADTAFWVAYYRAQESERQDAMFRDPLAAKLCDERGKKIAESMGAISFYSEWAVLSRTVIIDRFIDALVKDGVDAIINLGAGLDTRPYRMDLPQDLEWIEADHSSIIDCKNNVLADESPKCKLTRVAVDLSDDTLRKAFLQSVVPSSKKTLIITEGVVPYLAQDNVRELGNDLHSQERFAYWITEYYHPVLYPLLQHPARTAVMKNAPFQFYPESWFGFFESVGWKEKETGYAGHIAMEFGRWPPMTDEEKQKIAAMPEAEKMELLKRNGYTLLERA